MELLEPWQSSPNAGHAKAKLRFAKETRPVAGSSISVHHYLQLLSPEVRPTIALCEVATLLDTITSLQHLLL
eukprot:11191619-Lingulodinium_polyedra.AAC.1